jgi:hypothetical protein
MAAPVPDLDLPSYGYPPQPGPDPGSKYPSYNPYGGSPTSPSEGNPYEAMTDPSWLEGQRDLFNLWRSGATGEEHPYPINWYYQALWNYQNDPAMQQLRGEYAPGGISGKLGDIARTHIGAGKREAVTGAKRSFAEGRRKTGEAATRAGLGTGGFGPTADLIGRMGEAGTGAQIQGQAAEALQVALAQAYLQELQSRTGFHIQYNRDIADLFSRIGQTQQAEYLGQPTSGNFFQDLALEAVGGGAEAGGKALFGG